MLKFVALSAGLLFAGAASAQQSLEALHARVPAPPASAAAAPAWLAGPEVVALRKQIKDQRAFVEKLMKEANADAAITGAQTGGVIDFQRAQTDPEYAKQIQAKIAAMSQEEKMKLAMQMQQATQQNALRDVKAMAADPEAVTIAADHYADYQANPAKMSGIQAQATAIHDIQQRTRAKDGEITAKAAKNLKCSDGEGGCASKADEAADKATRKAAYDQVIVEYDKALASIRQQVEAARKVRAAAIAAAQRDLAPAQYGSAAKSSANRQLLATYHNSVLNEIEELMILSESAAQWAADRYQARPN